MLSLVRKDDDLTRAQQIHEVRAAWLESILVDRSRWKGSAGVEALRKLKPLAPDEQACQDCCEERVRAAKASVVWPCLVWRELAAKAAREK